MATRLSITLTDTQAEQLARLSEETGATRQSMIGLAITAWLRAQAPDNIITRHDRTIQPEPLTCEVCGAPADWASASDGIEHALCDEHATQYLRDRGELA